ncbi:MAG TPA: TolC family protein [Longimicrobium sp.]|nr:TolC family protein [Longimicrobium sp.]
MLRRTLSLTALALLAAAPLAAQSADSVSLSAREAVNRALEAGDEVRLATARRDAVSAQVGSARAAGLPQLRMAGSFSHVYENARAQAVGQIFNQPNSYNVNFNLSMPVFQGGRVGAGLRGARSLQGAAAADVEESQAEVTVLVLRAYLTALLADQLVAIQETNLRQAEARLAQVEQLERAGRAARYDVLRARVERANLEPALIQSRGDRELAFVELRRLLNLPASQPIRLTSGVDPDESRRLAEELEAAAARADTSTFSVLPAVRAAELRVTANRAAVSAARADYLPTVNMFVQSGWQAFPLETRFPLQGGALETVECPVGSDPDRVCTQQNGGWFSDRNLGVQVSWPIFDGMRARSNVAQARANWTIARLQARIERESAVAEAQRAAAVLRQAQALFAASGQTVSEAEEAFRLASLRYTRGLETQLAVSDAQLALLTARTNQARATHALFLAVADAARALGRPVPLPSGTPAPAVVPAPVPAN